jgi:hypothetical protein
VLLNAVATVDQPDALSTSSSITVLFYHMPEGPPVPPVGADICAGKGPEGSTFVQKTEIKESVMNKGEFKLVAKSAIYKSGACRSYPPYRFPC